MPSCDAALLTQVHPAVPSTLVFSLVSVVSPMADAAAPVVPRQQRRKEVRAQTNDDVRRVRQRLDDTERRLEALEGRWAGSGVMI